MGRTATRPSFPPSTRRPPHLRNNLYFFKSGLQQLQRKWSLESSVVFPKVSPIDDICVFVCSKLCLSFALRAEKADEVKTHEMPPCTAGHRWPPIQQQSPRPHPSWRFELITKLLKRSTIRNVNASSQCQRLETRWGPAKKNQRNATDGISTNMSNGLD